MQKAILIFIHDKWGLVSIFRIKVEIEKCFSAESKAMYHKAMRKK